MSKITFIGDVHAHFNEYVEICNKYSHTIQVGDFGAGFKTLPTVNLNHKFIRGNHDSPEICKNSENWIPDGSILNYFGKNILFIGGAKSIDDALRVEGISWWRDEECTYSQLNSFIDKAIETQPDIIVTHTCPISVSEEVFNLYSVDKTTTSNALEALFENYKPKLWIFGHWHRSIDKTLDGTRFMCLNELEAREIDLSTL